MKKFLPFITNDSSNESVFKAVLSCTKSLNMETITDIYYIILKEGIDAVRDSLNSYAADLTTPNRVKELISRNPDSRLPKSEYMFWSYVMRLEITDKNYHESFREHALIGYLSTLAVVSHYALKGAGTNIDYEKYVDYSKEDFDCSTKSIKNIVLSAKDSARIGFTALEEFKAYLAFKSCTKTEVRILPIFIKTSKNSEVTKEDYTVMHCTDPYTRT